MNNDNAEAIERYFDHFCEEYERILLIEVPLHQTILIVTFLSALARGRYPKTREGQDKQRFVQLIEEYSGWEDVRRVSVPQLLSCLEQEQSMCPSDFHNAVRSLFAQRRVRIANLSEDPELSVLENENPNKVETRLLSEAKHSSLLYHYRSRLVHEFRKPGYGTELSNDNRRPYYHWRHAEDETLTQELVYPTRWFTSLPKTVLTGLKAYYSTVDLDPYSGYDFGSHWRERRARAEHQPGN
jgi:hypothetical protein